MVAWHTKSPAKISGVGFFPDCHCVERTGKDCACIVNPPFASDAGLSVAALPSSAPVLSSMTLDYHLTLCNRLWPRPLLIYAPNRLKDYLSSNSPRVRRLSGCRVASATLQLISSFFVDRKRFHLNGRDDLGTLLIREFTVRCNFYIFFQRGSSLGFRTLCGLFYLGGYRIVIFVGWSEITIFDMTQHHGCFCHNMAHGHSFYVPYGLDGTAWPCWTCEMMRGSLNENLFYPFLVDDVPIHEPTWCCPIPQITHTSV